MTANTRDVPCKRCDDPRCMMPDVDDIDWGTPVTNVTETALWGFVATTEAEAKAMKQMREVRADNIVEFSRFKRGAKPNRRDEDRR